MILLQSRLSIQGYASYKVRWHETAVIEHHRDLSITRLLPFTRNMLLNQSATYMGQHMAKKIYQTYAMNVEASFRY